jgi:hypothetical protein
MTRALSPDSARIASDLIDQLQNADQITGTVNHQPDDIRAFRGSHASTSMAPALAGLSPRLSGPASSDAQAMASSSSHSHTAADIDRLASEFPTSHLASAPIRVHNPQDFSKPPPPSGDSVPSQSLSSGGISQAASAVSSSSGRPQRGTTPYSARTAPYPAPSSLSSGSSAVTRTRARRPSTAPVLPEHTALMGALPQGLSPSYRLHISRFLCHLERQDRAWSQLVPTGNTDVRPAALEQALNAGIREHGLQASTRAALNQAFGFVLQGESGVVRLAPVMPGHTALMGALPQGVSQQHRSGINRFLCHLEQQGRTWSQLVPAGNTDLRPAALEQAVNAGIREHGLHPGTRTALNQAFGFVLQGESGAMSQA